MPLTMFNQLKPIMRYFFYYASVAYIQDTYNKRFLDKFRSEGDYRKLLLVAETYDSYGAIDLKYTYKSATHNNGDTLLIEDDHYALTYNSSNGGTYELFRKETGIELRNYIAQNGLPSEVSKDIEELAKSHSEPTPKIKAKEIVSAIFKYGLLSAYEACELKEEYKTLSDKKKKYKGWTTEEKYLSDNCITPIAYGMIVCGALCAICFLACIGSIFLISACGWGGAVGYAALLFVVLYIASIYFYQRFYWYEMPKYNIEYR